jgi:hypothetical protein
MKNLQEYVSDMSVLCGAEKLTVEEGKGKGVTLIRMYNGKIQLFLKQDKCLDIFHADYKGENISFITKNGLTSPKLNNSATVNFLNGFDGGLLHTCGLDNIGTPKNINGRECIQHGSISYIPAENVNIETGCINNEYFVSVSGIMKYTALFGSFLVLKRKITLKYLSNDIIIEDEIMNKSFSDDQYMLLYHFNLGYPLLNECAKITFSDIEKTYFVNEKAEKNYSKYKEMEKPKPNCSEEVFIHKLKGKNAFAELNNGKLKFALNFSTDKLQYLTQWKSMSSGDYALGLEPATTMLNDRKGLKIKSGERHSYKLNVSISEK